MRDFITTIIQSIARGFGWRLGSDLARDAEKGVIDEVGKLF